MASIGKKALAEAMGTFWLVFAGCGTAVLAGHYVGVLGIALAFGLTVLAMVHAIGHISGAHLNPAVSCGAVACGRLPLRELPAYVVAQTIGGILAGAALYGIVHGAGEEVWQAVQRAGFAANGYGRFGGSPGLVVTSAGVTAAHSFGWPTVFLAELLLTFIFLMVILGATDRRAPAATAGLAIGLTLTLIHLVGIPIDNLSVNPARSTGPALFVGGWAVQQLWLFWLAPIAGGVSAGLTYRFLFASEGTVAAAPVATARSASGASGG